MNGPARNGSQVAQIIDVIIKVSVLALLAGWCLLILKPFITPVIWGIIIAVAIDPFFYRLSAWLGGRRKLAATLLVLAALLMLVLPSVKLADSMVNGAKLVSVQLQQGGVSLPPPPDGVRNWPMIGPALDSFWRDAATNLTATLHRFQPQLTALGGWLAEASLHFGIGLVMFVFSIVIAGVLLVNAESGRRIASGLFVRLAGERGTEFANDATITVRNVVKGILGVAIIQALLAGIGFAAASVPAAGLWAFLCLLLAVIQIGVGPVSIPVVIYMFYTADTTTAVLLAFWQGLVLVSDNILKPLLLGRGAPVPMPVIFLGSIGGFMSMGFLGLFIGAIVLSVGYKLFETWIRFDDDSSPGEQPADGSETSV